MQIHLGSEAQPLARGKLHPEHGAQRDVSAHETKIKISMGTAQRKNRLHEPCVLLGNDSRRLIEIKETSFDTQLGLGGLWFDRR